MLAHTPPRGLVRRVLLCSDSAVTWPYSHLVRMWVTDHGRLHPRMHTKVAVAVVAPPPASIPAEYNLCLQHSGQGKVAHCCRASGVQERGN